MVRGSESEVGSPPLSEHCSLEDGYWLQVSFKATLNASNISSLSLIVFVYVSEHLGISVCTESIIEVCDLTWMML